MTNDILFQPLQFRNLTIKNRLLRSNLSGRIDAYNGAGAPARVSWEARFARGGVGALVSSHVPVSVRGRILPNYAMIDRDERIPFWKEVVQAVHAHDCRYILQLSHSGHQQDVAGVENRGKVALSSTDKPDFFNGVPTKSMSLDEIKMVQGEFVAGARRAKAAGCDGIELHACNGYVFTQFLSSAVNTRDDDYGGSLENRARFLLEVVREIRKEVGRDYHFQVKITAVDYFDALEGPLLQPKGTTLDESLQVVQWLESEGVDAIHVSTGGYFPHPRNPAGKLPEPEAGQNYQALLDQGIHTLRNYVAFRWFKSLSSAIWERTTLRAGVPVEGICLEDARAIKASVSVPVICTGGFQRASFIRQAIEGGGCDAVSIGRPLMANPDLPLIFQQGKDEADKPCTFCNKCLARVLEDPLGCYDESRFDSEDDMIQHVMSFFDEGHWTMVDEPPAGT